MLFNSLGFLIFFPVVTLVYFLIPRRAQTLWLLGASYYFYMCWNPAYALLMLTSTAITYMAGRLLALAGGEGRAAVLRRRWTLALSFAANLGILFFFKYYYFTLDNLNLVLRLVGIAPLRPRFDVILPVGISFYTFQALGYTMDVYRGKLPAEKNFFRYALFVSFFPQLVAGPIERSTNLISQIHEEHRFDYERMKRGLLLMLWGYFQKLVLADRLAIAVDAVYAQYTAAAGWQLALATLCFAVQIYCDFSSYTDIARGAAEVMGFRLMENFRQPYFSRSIAEFWRNWHISLSTWFRDYLYIPLGGSRAGRWKKYRNILTVFLVSGLWHGASWHYVFYGLLHGLYQVTGDMTRGLRDRAYRALHVDPDGYPRKVIACLGTFVLLWFSWFFFRADSMGQAVEILGRLTAPGSAEGLSMGLSARAWLVTGFFTVVLIGCSVLRRRGIVPREKLLALPLPLRWSLYLIGIYTVLVFGVYGPGYNETAFIYFQF